MTEFKAASCFFYLNENAFSLQSFVEFQALLNLQCIYCWKVVQGTEFNAAEIPFNSNEG